MWAQWDPAVVSDDLARLAELGANAVRLVVEPDTFGYPTPSARMLQRLDAAVAMACAHGLAVQLTLFDWWASYDDVAGSRRWMQAVLAGRADDPVVALVELQNEIDPGDPAAMRWARTMLPQLDDLVPLTPTTVSVTGVDRLERLVDALGGTHVDVFDVHYYGDAADARDELARAQRAVAPTPLFVGETGASSGHDPHGAPDAAAEQVQAAYLTTLLDAAGCLGLPAPALWTLWDLEPTAVPRRAGVRAGSPELQFGLLRLDGSAKPAARVVQDRWHGRTAPACGAALHPTTPTVPTGSSEPAR
jgi:hypothetical protein